MSFYFYTMDDISLIKAARNELRTALYANQIVTGRRRLEHVIHDFEAIIDTCFVARRLSKPLHEAVDDIIDHLNDKDWHGQADTHLLARARRHLSQFQLEADWNEPEVMRLC